jgi:hypothetical protein
VFVVFAVCEKLRSFMLSSVRLKLMTSNSHTVGPRVCTEQCKLAPASSAQLTRMTAARLPCHANNLIHVAAYLGMPPRILVGSAPST